MSDQIQGSSDQAKDQARENLTPEVVSAARRWVVRAGLAAPIILTLRSKRLFGQTTTTVNCSAWMSASYLSASYALSGRPDPGPMPTECQQTTSTTG